MIKTITNFKTQTFEIIECCACGVEFGMTYTLVKYARATPSHYFYCPNGHSQHFAKDTEKLKLKREVERLKLKREVERLKLRNLSLVDQCDATERSNKALKGVVTKKKKELNRVKAGVCPCCNRTFKNLQRHMKCKHPKFAEEKGEE